VDPTCAGSPQAVIVRFAQIRTVSAMAAACAPKACPKPSAIVKNADGFDGVAARDNISSEASWDVPSGSVATIIDDWSECTFKSQLGFIKTRNLPLGMKLSKGDLADVKDSYEGNTETCMRRNAAQSTDGNVLCYVPNGAGMVTFIERWIEIVYDERHAFVKARHVQFLPASSTTTPAETKCTEATIEDEPPSKKAKTATVAVPPSETESPPGGAYVTEDMLGPVANLLVESQPDWRFELEKGKWRSYRPEDSIELDRYWKVYVAAKDKESCPPHLAKLRVMKKDVEVDLSAMTCQMGSGLPRALQRHEVDPGWLTNAYFCKAFTDALGSAAVGSETLVEDTFDFRFNQDFSEVKDDGRELYRGGERYLLPVGWKRFSVKVHGKYDDGDNSWLKEDESGWAVTYHGTSESSLPGILSTGFKVGPGQKFSAETGKGIYCTPWIDVAQHYSEPKPVDGHCVQVVLQLRVRPSAIKKVTKAPTEIENKYWVINDPKDIRAYGVLIRELAISDFQPALLMVYGAANPSVKSLMADLKKKAAAFAKAQKALAKAKIKAGSKKG